MAKRKRITRFWATWIGPKGYIRLSGVGRIFPGKEFEISEKQARAFEKDKENWKIRKSYEYEKIKK
jgi:hypothetical protein